MSISCERAIQSLNLIVSYDIIVKPPYQLSPVIFSLATSIAEKLGVIKSGSLQYPRAALRKDNQIKTIQSTLAIEGNSLNLKQVTALLENKRVLAPLKDILEVKNAIAVYEQLGMLEPFRLSSFLKAHKQMMKGLVKSAGAFRSGGVGIVKGTKLEHLPPPAARVKPLMKDLFSYLKNDSDPLLIKSCVFHYEMEFIHPFADGNGRMGRLWQTVILSHYNQVFAYLPVEQVVKNRQPDYYKALRKADQAGHSTPFIEFMLAAIDEALEQLLEQKQPPLSAEERVIVYKTVSTQPAFTRKQYMGYFRMLSTATASRDLQLAVQKRIVKRKGDKRTAIYSFLK